MNREEWVSELSNMKPGEPYSFTQEELDELAGLLEEGKVDANES